MKRIIIITFILLIAGASFLGGRKSTEPEYARPLSHELPTRSELNEVRKIVARSCAQGQPLRDGTSFDQHYYGHPDYWQDCRINGVGDCEDWALAFKNVFSEKYPHLAQRAAVRVLKVRDRHSDKWVAHAALIIDIGPGYVLDNLESAVYTVKAKESSYRDIREIKQIGTQFVFVVRSNA